MELLQAPFTAGSLTWVRYGASHHPVRHYDQVKIGVLLGTPTARWRFSEQHSWRTLPARSTGVCLGDAGTEAVLAVDLGWLAWPILAKRAWPKIRSESKRAITAAEHAAIIARSVRCIPFPAG